MNIASKIKSLVFRTNKVTLAPSDRLPLPRNAGWTGINGAQIFSIPIPGDIDYVTEVGDVGLNSAVATCLNWICTAANQAPPIVQRKKGKEWVEVEHPIIDVLNQPHPRYEGRWLNWMLLNDWWKSGNAYARIASLPNGTPIGLDWMPSRLVTPEEDEYIYRPNGQSIRVPFEDVIHFRFGVNPLNMLCGLTPLVAIFREIYCDNKAFDTAAAIYRNKGMPSGILGPDKDIPPTAVIDEDPEKEAKAIKGRFQQEFTGENLFKLMVMTSAYNYTALGFNPKDLDLSGAHLTPKERICAIFLIHPVVVNMGSGLDQATYNNAAQFEEAAWNNNVIPTQDYFGEAWSKLLRRFPQSDRRRVSYDRSNISVLQPDRSQEEKDALAAYLADVITLEECRSRMGLESSVEVLMKLAEQQKARPPKAAIVTQQPSQDQPPAGA